MSEEVQERELLLGPSVNLAVMEKARMDIIWERGGGRGGEGEEGREERGCK